MVIEILLNFRIGIYRAASAIARRAETVLISDLDPEKLQVPEGFLEVDPLIDQSAVVVQGDRHRSCCWESLMLIDRILSQFKIQTSCLRWISAGGCWTAIFRTALLPGSG